MTHPQSTPTFEQPFTYQGEYTREISFPLGGIGTGCIGLGGNGRLIDWEIFNRPNKGSFNGFSHFAVRAERTGQVIDARVLNSDFLGSYMGEPETNPYAGVGFGPSRQTLAGMPHFRDSTFTGTFPLARIDFADDSFPGQISLSAFNPFIPLNDRDSGIPAAFFEIEVCNTTNEPLTYGVAGTLANPLPGPQLHTVSRDATGCSLNLRSNGVKSHEVGYGDLTLATDATDTAAQAYWFRGGWKDNIEIYWRDLTSPGALPERTYPEEKVGDGNHGTLLAPLRLKPGEAGRVRFVITWNFPNCERYWTTGAEENDCGCEGSGCSPNKTWRNYYATQWPDSAASAAYCLTEWDRLERETRLFHDTLFSSTLPAPVIDAVSANISILKTPTVLRLEDGTFYGWEGCCATAGCCEGSCTHVWNYAQALPFLFPNLERSMRDADYRYNLRPDGGMPFRLQLPLGAPRSAFRPCPDGQLGGVLKVYRDWKISGDTEWLRELWPAVKASLEFAWSPDNDDRWDPDQTGVLHGRQHHTLDHELFGPNSWLTGFYLGALKAGAEMAAVLGEEDAAEQYQVTFERGQTWVESNLYNGVYYNQQIDLKDRGLIEAFDVDGEALGHYWNEEHKEIKYQIGKDGCAIDQVLAQWHADLYGLGKIFDRERVHSALAAVYRHNFKPAMRTEANTWRLFALNDEAGLVICDWPDGVKRPAIPLPYAPETMTGFEYAAACAMIQNGLIEEGLAVVKAVRDRYDGKRRNPWNEIECGSNYARAMASYALLNAFSGFTFDLTRGMIGFKPVVPGEFRCFWSLGHAWGELGQSGNTAQLSVLHGQLEVKELHVHGVPVAVECNQRVLGFSLGDLGGIHLEQPLVMTKGDVLRIGCEA
jgi:non-lysosomal glucosylceramidase